MEPVIHDDRVAVYQADCLDVMRDLADASVDAVVTDPPYGLEFMGKEWDRFESDKGWRRRQKDESDDPDKDWGVFNRTSKNAPHLYVAGSGFQVWCQEWTAECLRVLKPGGHMLAFGGTRTWHRLACAIEDAGFEVRDSLAWLYGSGFPKSLDVSKAIDKAAGAERTLVGIRKGAGTSNTESLGAFAPEFADTAPATDAARTWQGWGTALKPAFEPIVVARKPLTGTVAANVLEWGTGALNIDGCRIAGDVPSVPQPRFSRDLVAGFGASEGRNGEMSAAPAGRWPANVVLDENQAAALDEQSGLTSGAARVGPPGGRTFGGSEMKAEVGVWYGDTGGASRFFYVAKAPKKERPKMDGIAHPTVKPLTLMRWLCRLVTPPDGLILEPFAGSGTTVEAALLEGFRVIAIEREHDYLPLIQARLNRVKEADDGQLTLDS